jgi:hypothetical protein
MIVDMGKEKTYDVRQASNKKQQEVCIIMVMTTSKRRRRREKKDNAQSIYPYTNANHYIARKLVYDNEQSFVFLLSLIKRNRCYRLFRYLHQYTE